MIYLGAYVMVLLSFAAGAWWASEHDRPALEDWCTIVVFVMALVAGLIAF